MKWVSLLWEKLKKYLWEKQYLYSFYWFLLTSLFGLSQIWINFLTPDSLSMDEIFVERGILLFSIALTASLWIDYFLFSTKKSYNKLEKFMFSMFPGVLILVSAVVFTSYRNPADASKDLEFIKTIQIIIFILTAGYAIWLKIDRYKFKTNRRS